MLVVVYENIRLSFLGVYMLEDLLLYKIYVDLMYYSYNLVIKYPKSEKLGIVSDIKNNLYLGLNNIIYYHKSNKKIYLDYLDNNLKVLLVLIRISYKMKYISNKNYLAFSKKINNINKLIKGLIRYENNKK